MSDDEESEEEPSNDDISIAVQVIAAGDEANLERAWEIVGRAKTIHNDFVSLVPTAFEIACCLTSPFAPIALKLLGQSISGDESKIDALMTQVTSDTELLDSLAGEMPEHIFEYLNALIRAIPQIVIPYAFGNEWIHKISQWNSGEYDSYAQQVYQNINLMLTIIRNTGDPSLRYEISEVFWPRLYAIANSSCAIFEDSPKMSRLFATLVLICLDTSHDDRVLKFIDEPIYDDMLGMLDIENPAICEIIAEIVRLLALRAANRINHSPHIPDLIMKLSKREIRGWIMRHTENVCDKASCDLLIALAILSSVDERSMISLVLDDFSARLLIGLREGPSGIKQGAAEVFAAMCMTKSGLVMKWVHDNSVITEILAFIVDISDDQLQCTVLKAIRTHIQLVGSPEPILTTAEIELLTEITDSCQDSDVQDLAEQLIASQTI